MKSPKHGFKFGEEGKGSLGCIFAIILMAIAIFLAFKLGPPYMNHYEFKGEMKQVVSRAGARAIPEETIKKDLISLAQKSNIALKNEDIEIRRLSGQIIIRVEYIIPLNFIIMKHDLRFQVEESSFTTI